MRQLFPSLIAVGLGLLLASSADAGEAKLAVAVAPFDNHTGSAAFQPLSKGLADMLLTDLGAAGELQLIERERIAAIIAELKLGQGGLVDPKTAQKMGQLVGADLLLVGSIAAVSPTLRLDARFIAVGSGEIVASAKAEGSDTAFFEVEASLVKRLLEAIGVKLSPIQRLRVDKPATRSLPALTRYGEALDAADRKDPQGEKAALQAALQADPTFARAQQRLSALEERLAALEKRTEIVERAGGLVVKPTTAADFWGNHKILLERRDVAGALGALQGLLAVAPTSLDGLAAYVNQVHATAGRAPTSADLGRISPRLDLGVAAVLGAIAARDLAAAEEASVQLLARRRGDPLSRWLRLLALGPKSNPTPTAAERSEELSHLLQLAGPEEQRALAGLFTAKESLDAATAHLGARRGHYAAKIPRWGRRRADLLLPGVALGVTEATKLWVRIAEPGAKEVEVALPGGEVVRPTFQRTPELEGEVTAFTVRLDPKHPRPTGAQRATVRYRDGKGRPVAITLGLWLPPGTSIDENRGDYMSFTVYGPEARPASLLVDGIARIWTVPRRGTAHSASFRPLWETLPFAWGNEPLFYRTAEVAGTGFTRPVMLRFTDGEPAYGLIGKVEYAWEERPGGGSRMRTAEGSAAQEVGAGGRPWYRYGQGYAASLLDVGHPRDAIDLALALDDVGGDPEQSFRGPLAAPGGDYRWLALLAAARGIGHRYADLRRGAAFLPGGEPDTEWLRQIVRHLDGELPLAELVAGAKSRDGQRREGSYPDRFFTEAVTYAALANPRWHADGALRALVTEALPKTPLTSTEYWLLAALVRERNVLHDGAPAKVGGVLLDRFEVSAREYLACVQAGACRRPSPSTCSVAQGGNDAFTWTEGTGSGCWLVAPNDYPINWVSRAHAAAYCAWRGGRLPTSAEWTAAARGTGAYRPSVDNLLDAVACELSHVKLRLDICGERAEALQRENPFDGYLGLAPRGAHPAGRSSDGLEQLLGNLREWVRDGDNLAAGCSYHDPPDALSGERCAQRVASVATVASGHVGFRCAYDTAPKLSPEAQAERERRPPPATGQPSLRWVKVPAGKLDRGAQEPVVTLRIEAAPAPTVAAVAAKVHGLSAAELGSFVAALRGKGITGELTSHHLEELVQRGRYRGKSPQQVFRLVLELIEPQGDQAAQDAANARAKEELALSVYHSGAFSRYGGDKPEALTVAQRRQALFNYAFHYDGNSSQDLGMGDRMAPIVRLQGRPTWSDNRAPGCLEQAPGRCLDVTGISGGELKRDSGDRQEPVEVAAFAMLATEVTQAQYQKLTGGDPALDACADCPVTQVSWDDAAAFCKAAGGRLPSHDEWEWAARGGVAVGRYAPLSDGAWTILDGGDRPRPVGKKRPNAYGLHDLLGNVWEWVGDDWERGRDYQKGVRGGSFASDPRLAVPEQRVPVLRRMSSDFIGFRCVR